MKRGRLEKTSLSFRFYGHAFVFFFSSRRRHTRCSRDWSSDVCSSDLTAALAQHRLPDQSRRSLNGGMSAVLGRDRKSTRLNSSHGYISYAVFCLKKKKKQNNNYI